MQTQDTYYAAFTQACGGVFAKCSIGNDLTLKCVDDNGTPFNFGETDDGYVVFSQGTVSSSYTPIKISVLPAGC